MEKLLYISAEPTKGNPGVIELTAKFTDGGRYAFFNYGEDASVTIEKLEEFARDVKTDIVLRANRAK